MQPTLLKKLHPLNSVTAVVSPTSSADPTVCRACIEASSDWITQLVCRAHSKTAHNRPCIVPALFVCRWSGRAAEDQWLLEPGLIADCDVEGLVKGEHGHRIDQQASGERQQAAGRCPSAGQPLT